MESNLESKPKQLPDRLKRFIADSKWTFAITYAKNWPHEYIVQERVDSDLFLALAHHIDTYGYESHFYNTKLMYFDYDGNTYWHMDNIINRCVESETYRRREIEGRLPAEENRERAHVKPSAVESRLVYGCGFEHFRSVDGRTSVQHLIPQTQSGIYVLAHKDGTYYVGLSVDLGRRFEQHVENKRPIAAYAFRKVHKTNLDKTESETISILKDMGVEVTNTEKMGAMKVEDAVSDAIPSEDIKHWLSDDSWNDLKGTAPESPRPHGDIENKYRSEFLHKPYVQGILDFYADYVAKCIYKPFRTAPDKWNVTCLPSTRYKLGETTGKAVSLINVGAQYSVLLIDDHGKIMVSLAVKKSIFRRAHPDGIEDLRFYAPSVREEKATVTALGDDQLEILVPLSEAKALLKDKGLISSIRALVVHNRGMNQTGSSVFKRFHCYAFAKDILQLIADK